MSKRILGWFGLNRTVKNRKSRQQRGDFGGPRLLRHEVLEDRRMLAILTVNVNHDNVDPFGNPLVDDGDLTLRDAIAYVNLDTFPGPTDADLDQIVGTIGQNDTIIFSTDPLDGLNGATITLGRDANGDPLPAAPGVLQISESLTIDATALTSGITIDASGTDPTPTIDDGLGTSVFDLDFKIFKPNDFLYQATFAGLTITGGDTERGGGINLNGWIANAAYRVSLTIVDTVIKNNYASDVGGGVNVYGWELGAGLLDVNIIRSTIENNTAAGDVNPGPLGPGDGGGIYVALNEGDLNTNTGAVFNLIDSTVANNEATNGDGGGIWFNTDGRGTFNAVNSTISGNRALNGQGGGLAIGTGFDSSILIANLDHVTITDNASPDGGGLFSEINPLVVTTLNNTIVSGNRVAVASNSTANNIAGAIDAVMSRYNLTGTGITPTGAGNIFNDDPGLAPLANNGGPTKTHMPTINVANPTMDAIDAGDPAAVAGVAPIPEFDQRGDPYTRVFDGDEDSTSTIDIGAVEYGVGTPRVTDVILEGSDSAWIRDPFRFSTIVEAGAQLRPIFAEGIDTIKIQFSEDVSFASSGSELTLVQTMNIPSGGATNTTLDNSKYSFIYHPEILTGIWTFDQPTSTPLVNGKYAIHLTTSSIIGGGEALDGEWDNDDNGDLNGDGIYGNDNTPDDYTDDVGKAFLSGDGWANSTSGEFRFHFAVLHGDYDQNGVVDFSADTMPNVKKDGNGDRIIDSSDDSIVTANDGKILPLRGVGGADFFDDEIINVQDLVIWDQGLSEFGGSGVAGDADGDGDVDANDFLFWQRARASYSAWYISGLINVGIGSSTSLVLVGLAPQITNLVISGLNSQHNPFSFDTIDGSGTQLQTVPVGAADTISITFSELVNISADSLRVIGLSTANVPQLAAFTYDVLTMTATWRFESWALGDQYLISLPDSITDVEGNLLDGEWTNPTSINTVNSLVSTFPSGDGTAGGNFNFVATLLPGDANLDGIVNVSDLGILSANWGVSTNALFENADFDGNGTVDGNDFNLMLFNWGANLQNVWVLADIDGDFVVDDSDIEVINDNWGMTGATYTDGDLNGDGTVDLEDLDLAFAQYGLGLLAVS